MNALVNADRLGPFALPDEKHFIRMVGLPQPAYVVQAPGGT